MWGWEHNSKNTMHKHKLVDDGGHSDGWCGDLMDVFMWLETKVRLLRKRKRKITDQTEWTKHHQREEKKKTTRNENIERKISVVSIT